MKKTNLIILLSLLLLSLIVVFPVSANYYYSVGDQQFVDYRLNSNDVWSTCYSQECRDAVDSCSKEKEMCREDPLDTRGMCGYKNSMCLLNVYHKYTDKIDMNSCQGFANSVYENYQISIFGIDCIISNQESAGSQECSTKFNQCLNDFESSSQGNIRKGITVSLYEPEAFCFDIYSSCCNKALRSVDNIKKFCVDENDHCDDGILDFDEEGIDCGGSCSIECEDCDVGFILVDGECVLEDDGVNVKITPGQITIPADKESTQEFVVSIKNTDGTPVVNEPFEVFIKNSYGVKNPGSISLSSGRTDQNGQTKIIYTSGYAEKYERFGHANILIQVKHKKGNPYAQILLGDTKPKLEISAVPRVIQDIDDSTGGVSNILVKIDDPDSLEWNYEVAASIGEVAIGSKSSEILSLTGTITKPELSIRWLRPDDLVELRDFELTMDRDDAGASKGFKNNLRNSGVGAISDDFSAQIQGDFNTANDLSGSASYIADDLNRIKNSASTTSSVLTGLSTGLEVLQMGFGSKNYLKSKKNYLTGADSSSLENLVTGIRDATIGVGIDLLQSRLRSWADAEHELSLDSMRVPVTILIKITDDSDQTVVEPFTLQYVYTYNPTQHIENLNGEVIQ